MRAALSGACEALAHRQCPGHTGSYARYDCECLCHDDDAAVR